MLIRFWKDEYFLDKARLISLKQEKRGKIKPGPAKSLKFLKLQFLYNAIAMALIAILSAYLANDAHQNNREVFLFVFFGFFVIYSVIAFFDTFRFFKINSVLAKAVAADKLFEDVK